MVQCRDSALSQAPRKFLCEFEAHLKYIIPHRNITGVFSFQNIIRGEESCWVKMKAKGNEKCEREKEKKICMNNWVNCPKIAFFFNLFSL